VAPPGNQAANREDKLQPIAMEGPGLLDNVQYRILNEKQKQEQEFYKNRLPLNVRIAFLFNKKLEE
jgi:hypothetical protein